MKLFLLCFTLATSPIHKPMPRIISDQWKLIDGGKRWKQTCVYSDGSRKCFIVEIPVMK